MKQRTYELMCKRMKAQGITLSELTKEVNKTAHVCEQEMINYMLAPEEMPDEVETALKDIFTLHDLS
ncbi:hypothetical protein [Longicatena caecimuris]|uniref:HTH cro/C1-type domain-containing protein n=1 Tax=Longicatena caecimuris TaxID=1796635 RepID=A0A4R3TFE8_9FIRM|nr:hypothetical protein [Longicatena caecimuris]MCR1870212.1 hypothetical protein [Longicatena caecimuris]MCU0102729.1 hypothetical protein [Longicatena caecimuris]TCU59986.1 hypothetical protein EDD61_10923 [Longicatena caecimuris]